MKVSTLCIVYLKKEINEICHSHPPTPHRKPYLPPPPPPCISIVFTFISLGTVCPQNEENYFAKFGGVNKMYYVLLFIQNVSPFLIG